MFIGIKHKITKKGTLKYSKNSEYIEEYNIAIKHLYLFGICFKIHHRTYDSNINIPEKTNESVGFKSE